MSALTLWGAPYRPADPFAQFDALVRRAFPEGTAQPTGFTPAADVTRDGDDAVIRLELPGVEVDKDVTVEVDHDRLVVRGERRDETSSDDEHGTRREVRYGSFRRTFRLPAHVDAEAVSASYDAGVLTVRVTGAHTPSEPARIAVTGPTAESTESTPESDPEA